MQETIVILGVLAVGLLFEICIKLRDIKDYLQEIKIRLNGIK